MEPLGTKQNWRVQGHFKVHRNIAVYLKYLYLLIIYYITIIYSHQVLLLNSRWTFLFTTSTLRRMKLILATRSQTVCLCVCLLNPLCKCNFNKTLPIATLANNLSGQVFTNKRSCAFPLGCIFFYIRKE